MEVPIGASQAVCGACGKAVRREAVVHAADAGLLCPLCFTKADILAARRRAGFEGRAVALVGVIATVIPLLAQAASRPGDGASHRDWIALASGVAAVLCGGSTIAAARARARGGWLVVGALALGAGRLSPRARGGAGRLAHQVASRKATKITIATAAPSAR
jgi:hypothetical protein